MRVSRLARAVDLGLVKQLRAETKAGVMSCRDALEETGGDYDKAKALVMSKLKNREGKVMSEGLVAVHLGPEGRHHAAVVEVACETDFVARGTSLARVAAACATAAGRASGRGGGDGEAELIAQVKEAAKAELTEAARATGERIDVRRAWRVAREGAHVASYLHAPSGQARVAAVAVLEAAAPPGTVGSRLAVHIAGMSPKSREELLEQPFGALGAGSGTVGAELAKRGMVLREFVRVEVGEGVVATQEDFAESVKAAMRY